MHSLYRLFGNPRIGRFFAVDPLAPEYPHNSPYAFSENCVINAVELEGLEKIEKYKPTNYTKQQISRVNHSTSGTSGIKYSESGGCQSWFLNSETGGKGLLKEARSQIKAADGNKLKWVFDNEKAMIATQKLFKKEGVTGIEFQYLPKK